MKTRILFMVSVVVFGLINSGRATSFEITEFMAANQRTLNDEDGDSSDWIEIHNAGPSAQSLEGWFLTDDPSDLTQWRFPNQLLEPNAYLVVFASGKNKTDPAGRLHTNFRLASGGEYLALVDPQTNVISQFASFPAQQPDISYGRDAADTSITGYFLTPTPGQQNAAAGAGFASEVFFSRPSGTFVINAPFALTLSAASNAAIYYAFGTNIPDPTSILYTGPIQITNTTIVRARAFQSGLLPGPIKSKTFIALANDGNVLNFNSHLPIIILHNYGEGVFPQIHDLTRDLILFSFEPGFGRSSMTNPPAMAERGIFQLRGAATLAYPKSSFTLETQDELRNDKDVPLLGLPAESDWVLHAPNSFEPSLFHDPLALQLARDLGQYASNTRFVEVFLKDDSGPPGPVTWADYNGIYVLEERVKRAPNRVDIAKLEPEHIHAPEVTGGYLFSLDRIGGEPPLNVPGASLNWIDPNGFLMTNAVRAPQRSYISNYFAQFQAALLSPNYTNPATGYEAYIDVDSWVTRHIHEVLMFNVDSLRLNAYFYKPRNGKIHFGPAWDFDRSQGSTDSRDFNPRTWRSRVGDFGTDFFNFAPWWGRLFTAPDFWQRWIDKYEEFRAGPLSTSAINSRIEQLAAQIRPADGREVARWPAHAPRVGAMTIDSFTYDFGPTNDYDNEVRWKTFWYSSRLDFMDTQFLARPYLSSAGGPVSAGQSISITPASKPGTVLFYTLDGTDPRLSGGAISPTALSNNGPVTITINDNVRVFARSWNPNHRNLTGPNNPPLSSPWSGSSVASYYTHIPPLRITEIMYHPEDPPAGSPYTADDFQYLEVKNVGTGPLNVNRFTISGGIDFEFPNAILEADKSAVIVANQAAFQSRYGTSARILGVFSKKLAHAGERLVLAGAAQEPILDFSYDDSWYPITDGFSFSLVIANDQSVPDAWDLKSSWRPSADVGGSPAQNDPTPPSLPRVVINEINTDSTDWIELRNLSTDTALISGWYLTDDFRDPKKYRIPAVTIIAAGDYFYTEAFTSGARPFSFSRELGGEVYLFSADGVGRLSGYVHGFAFGAAQKGKTFGRYVISTGEEHFPPMFEGTPGRENSIPLIRPGKITEIHYHPIDNYPYSVHNEMDQFIEVNSDSLYDPDHPTNTWRLRGSVNFDFPPNAVVSPAGYALVVAFDPANSMALADFRARYAVPADVPIYGPFGGSFSDPAHSIQLLRPDEPEPPGPPNFGIVPYIVTERLDYSDQAPWPAAADGFGPSLQRIDLFSYGNDPINWVAAAPSPGRPYGGGTLPVITSQPQDTTGLVDGMVTLSLQAQGSNLLYQWRFNNTIIPDATNSDFILYTAQPSQAGNYMVVVMNPAGAVASRIARLTLLKAATITLNPESKAVTVGQSVTFTVNASSTTPISYQWLHNGVPIAGATGVSYTISSVDYADRGTYRARVTDSAGSVFSQAAELTVLIAPVILANPVSQSVPRGSSVTLSVTVTNTATLPIGYRWRKNGATTVSNWLSVYSDFLTITNVQATNVYGVAVYNQAQPAGFISASAVVTPEDDSDADGMPDDWEASQGFDVHNAADATADADGDGMTNLAEYIAGTDPHDARSYLLVRLVEVSSGISEVLLQFMAVSNKTYSVQYRNDLRSGVWQKLTDVPAAPTNHVAEIIDNGPNAASRYYQLLTPSSGWRR